MFDALAAWIAKATGSPWAFTLALFTIVAWGMTGPIFHFSSTWQLIINTGTTIVTFLMVFLIQNAQNRDTMALHLKLDELIKATTEARDEVMDVEDLSQEALQHLKEDYLSE